MTRGIDALADALATNTKLEALDLRYNRLTDAHCPALRRGLEKNRHLQTLLLSWNNEITNAGGREVFLRQSRVT